MPPHVTVPPGGAARGDATRSFCVVWSADFPDETGFRVTVRYDEGAREVFTHTVGPDEHDFVFPPDEAPVLVGAKCNDRRSFSIQVFALRPGGEEFVGGEGTVAECRLAP